MSDAPHPSERRTDDALSSAELLPLVYDELRRLAARKMAGESDGQTLQPTALVHEAYLRLAGSGDSQRWDHRGHFYAAAAEAMRRILVDRARRKRRVKHGGNRVQVEWRDAIGPASAPLDEVMAVHDALDALAEVDQDAAVLVKLHYFAGLPLEETAELMEISPRTAYRRWSFARAWLSRRLADDA